MRRFSLRHLFLLTSIFCLWFGAYAYWRHLLVFAMPIYLGIAGGAVYLVRSARDRTTRLLVLGFLTGINLACVGVAIGYGNLRETSPIEQMILASYWEVVFLAGLVVHAGFQLINSDDLDSSFVLGILFMVVNFLVSGYMLIEFLTRTGWLFYLIR